MRRILVVSALAVLSTSPVWAIYGANTDVGSADTTFQWVGSAGGASGVLIAPNWVITAQHVGGTNFTLDGTTYTADATYDNSNYDVHLMHFAHTFGGYYSLFAGNPIGQTVNLVGFGNSGSLRADGLGYDDLGGGGTRRAATNVIGGQQIVSYNGWNTPELLCDLDAPNGNTLSAPYNRDYLGDGGPTPNEGGLMAGDSGGAWLIDVGGTYELAGVSNYIFYDDQVNGASYYMFGVSGSTGADLTDPGLRSWVVGTVPEPVSSAAFAVGLIGLLAKRRRARK